MISVIIPTMWRAPHIHKMLPMLNSHSLIGEIIIIDNDTSKCNLEEVSSYSKVVYLPQETNIYVNPAWNLGVKLSKHNILMFLNDDCLVNLNCFYDLINEITPNRGLFGFSSLSYCGFSFETFDKLKDENFGEYVSIEESFGTDEFSGMPHPFYGSVMLTHKESYIDIPEEFKIYYGDLFIYTLNRKNNKQNYTIEDGLVITNMSTTVSQQNEQLQKEKQVFYEVFARYGI